MSLTLILGDCRERLVEYEGQIDFIFADPPYAISNRQNLSNSWNGYTSWKGDWDEIEEDYTTFTQGWVTAACRALTPSGIFSVSGVFGSLVPVWQSLLENNMLFLSHLVWHKTNPAPTIHRRIFTHSNEIILVFAKGKRWHYDYWRAKSYIPNTHNVLSFPAGKRKGGIISKPLGLLTFLVDTLTPPDGLVLDPFVGTGTTMLAAAKLNRSAVGIDRESLAVAISRERLLEAGFQITGEEAMPVVNNVYHRQVCEWLSKLGVQYMPEYQIGPYSIDIFLPELQRCVEIDGPSHKLTRKKDAARDIEILKAGVFSIVHIDVGMPKAQALERMLSAS